MNDRSTYIGGSDVAAILGISPWRTAWDVWAEKTSDPSWQPVEETPAMRWGTLLEPLLIEEYERQTERTVVDRQLGVSHGTYPFLQGHLDGRVYGHGILEVKTAHSAKGWGEPGAPTVPEHYLAQVHLYLALTDAPLCDVAVLLPRGDFRIIEVQADEALQRNIITAMVAFWENHVVPKIPPPMDTSAAAGRWLAAMPDDDEDVLEAGPDLEDIVERLAGVKEAGKALASTQELLENQAKAIIGEHQKAVGRGWHVTYKRNKPFRQTDWKYAAQEMQITMQLAGFGEEAEAAIESNSKMVENRRPFVLKKEEEEA